MMLYCSALTGLDSPNNAVNLSNITVDSYNQPTHLMSICGLLSYYLIHRRQKEDWPINVAPHEAVEKTAHKNRYTNDDMERH